MANAYFDPEWYKQQYGSQLEDGQTPWEHFSTTGYQQGNTPFQGWDPNAYLGANSDLTDAFNNDVDGIQNTYGDVNNWALGHYAQWGYGENRTYDGMPMSVMDRIEQDATNPALPPGTAYVPTMQTPNPEEFMNAPQLDPTAGQVSGTEAESAAPVENVQEQDAATYEADTINPDDVPQSEAEQGTVSEDALVEAEQGTLNPEISALLDPYINSDVEFDERSLVQFQYGQLTDFDPGSPPNWARGAIREAMSRMAARGITSSTMMGEAITGAVLAAALPIAQQDAKVFETLMHKKLDQKAQATFLKAGYLASMDMKNLDNRQQAAVVNAQSFLAMDLQNLANRQQSAVINTQMRQQAMLSNQAATNAAKQFNAASENQMRQFYDTLNTSINTFNASQFNEMSRFNTGQTNAIAMFNSNLQNDREKFNISNAMIAEQSNVNYLRQINTFNTQTVNEANRINSQNLLQISTQAMNNLFMWERDMYKYAMDESAQVYDRETKIMMSLMANEAAFDWMTTEKDMEAVATWAEVIGNIFVKG